jgi:hypothetical protein
MTDGLKDAHREAIIAVIAANGRMEGAVCSDLPVIAGCGRKSTRFGSELRPRPSAARVTVRPNGSRHCRLTMPPGVRRVVHGHG